MEEDTQLLSESLLSALDKMAEQARRDATGSLMLEGEIVDTIDAGRRVYSVSYMGNTFTAYGTNETQYNVGDIIYFLVPDGDMNKVKAIIGLADPENATTSVTSTPPPAEKIIGNNLFSSVPEIELSTYKDEEQDISSYLDEQGTFNYLFDSYLKDEHKNFNLSFDVRTDIAKEQQVAGEYGLRFSFPVINSDNLEDWYDVEILTKDMQGSVYSFEVYQRQTIAFDFPAEYTFNNSTRQIKGTAFVKDFSQDETKADIKDIFIKNISLFPIKRYNPDDNDGLKVEIKAEDGPYFLNSTFNSTKTLTPILKINGLETSTNGYDFYWFRENGSISRDSEKYYPVGGIGWECLNPQTEVSVNEDGRKTYMLNTAMTTIQVVDASVIETATYKVVLVKGEESVEGTITLRNLNNDATITLTSKSGSTTYIKDLGTVNLVAYLYYPQKIRDSIIQCTFKRYDKDGYFLDDDFYSFVSQSLDDEKKEYSFEISFPVSMIQDANFVSCCFTEKDTAEDGKEKDLGTRKILLSTQEEKGIQLILQNSDLVYKYDTTGNSPFVANYDGAASATVKEILPLGFKLFNPADNGNEFTEEQYKDCQAVWRVPNNSMIVVSAEENKISEDDRYSYYLADQLSYGIERTFDATKNENEIQVTVSFNDTELVATTNLVFIKDGASGTNGSKYTTTVAYKGYTYQDKDNEKEFTRKCQAVFDASVGQWKILDQDRGVLKPWTAQPFVTTVYKEGKKVYTQGQAETEGSGAEKSAVSYSITYSLVDINSPQNGVRLFQPFNISRDGILTLGEKVWSDPNEVPYVMIESETNITDGSNEETIYAYYPIECSRINGGEFCPTIDGGFSEVVYNTDGTEPKFSPQPFKITNVYNNQDIIKQFFASQGTWQMSENLVLEDYDEVEATITPIPNFKSPISDNFIRIALDPTDNFSEDIEATKIEKEQEINDADKEARYFSGVKSHLNPFCASLDYKKFRTMLEEAATKTFLSKRFALSSILDKIVGVLDDFYKDVNSRDPRPYDILKITTAKNKVNKAREELFYLNYGDAYVQTDLLPPVSESYEPSLRAILGEYITEYNNLVAEYNSELSIFRNAGYDSSGYTSFVNEVTSLANNEDLIWLTSSHEGIGPISEFAQWQGVFGGLNSTYTRYTSSSPFSLEDNLKRIKGVIDSTVIRYQNNDNLLEDQWDRLLLASIEKKQEIEDEYYALSSLNTYSQSTIIHIRPIFLHMNNYAMGWLNKWNGAAVEINKDEGYIISPMVGAGKKVNDKFVGIVMGDVQDKEKKKETGLFGFSQEGRSIFLNAEDGSATFGLSGSQIKITPDEQTITGGGMTINFSKTPSIKWDNNNFSVNSEGHLYCQEAEVKGKITADSGKIGDKWTIDKWGFHGGDGNFSKNLSARMLEDGHSGLSFEAGKLQNAGIVIGEDEGSPNETDDVFVTIGKAVYYSKINEPGFCIYGKTSGIGGNYFLLKNGTLESHGALLRSAYIQDGELKNAFIESAKIYQGEIGGWTVTKPKDPESGFLNPGIYNIGGPQGLVDRGHGSGIFIGECNDTGPDLIDGTVITEHSEFGIYGVGFNEKHIPENEFLLRNGKLQCTKAEFKDFTVTKTKITGENIINSYVSELQVAKTAVFHTRQNKNDSLVAKNPPGTGNSFNEGIFNEPIEFLSGGSSGVFCEFKDYTYKQNPDEEDIPVEYDEGTGLPKSPKNEKTLLQIMMAGSTSKPRNIAIIKNRGDYSFPKQNKAFNSDLLLMKEKIYDDNRSGLMTCAILSNEGITIKDEFFAYLRGRLVGIADTATGKGNQKANKVGIRMSKFGNLIPIDIDRGDENDADNNSEIDIGSNVNYFRKGFFREGVANKSDKKDKNHIEFLTEDYDNLKEFFMDLKPTKYEWKKEEKIKKVHFGFYAQDVFKSGNETLGEDLSFTSAVLKDENEKELTSKEINSLDDNDLQWSMNYTELIAPCVQMIQQQQKEIEELKEMIKALQK